MGAQRAELPDGRLCIQMVDKGLTSKAMREEQMSGCACRESFLTIYRPTLPDQFNRLRVRYCRGRPVGPLL